MSFDFRVGAVARGGLEGRDCVARPLLRQQHGRREASIHPDSAAFREDFACQAFRLLQISAIEGNRGLIERVVQRPARRSAPCP
jgi:hypothetical protein